MIKRDVLLKDHDDVLDGRCGVVIRTAAVLLGDGACSRDDEGQSGYQA